MYRSIFTHRDFRSRGGGDTVSFMRKYLFSIVDNDDTILSREISTERAMDLMIETDDRIATPTMRDEEKDAGVPTPPKHERVREAMDSTRTGRGNGPKRYAPKECCGSKGPRHLKECQGKPVNNTRSSTEEKAYETKNKIPLTRIQYDAIRVAMHEQRESFNSAKYGMVNKVSPIEVKTATRSSDFDDYLAIRSGC